jgi:uroporphyrinogen-III decarboxylase
MTGRERILAVLTGQKPDHLPCMPITMMFAADILGVKYGQYARDHRIMVDAQIKTAEIFGLDYVSTISDPAKPPMREQKFSGLTISPRPSLKTRRCLRICRHSRV